MAVRLKSELVERPLSCSAYLDQAPDGDLVAALTATRDPGSRFPPGWFSARERHTCQVGTWTVNDLLQHCIDSERISAYRALRIARGDPTPLPGFDQDPYALQAHADGRDLPGLLAEMTLVRDGTISLFASLGRDALLARGTCSGFPISAAALGSAIVGHQLHHLAVRPTRNSARGPAAGADPAPLPRPSRLRRSSLPEFRHRSPGPGD